MKPNEDPFFALPEPAPEEDCFQALQQRPASPGAPIDPRLPMVARLHGFDLLERPLVHGLPGCPGEVLACRSTVALKRAFCGREVLVLCEAGDLQQPIIIGVIEPHALQTDPAISMPTATAQVDGERYLIEAEREVVLRCGDASITLTRAGKVIIKGTYILSRSSGYNKIKGAAIDIN